MFEDSPVHVNHVLAIKATVDDMRSQNEATHRLLQDVLDKLGPAQARSAGKVFLTSCRTYIRLCPESFEDDLTKVIWAMFYMKAGRAGCWANHEFEHEAKSGHLRFIDWVDFEEEF